MLDILKKTEKISIMLFLSKKESDISFPAYTQGTLEWHKMAEEVYDSGR